MTFGDVNLAEEPIGGPYQAGAGGWPTVRYFNKATGYPHHFAGSAIAAARPLLGDGELKDALRTNRRAALARHEWASSFDDSDDNPADFENAPFLPPPVAPPCGDPRVRDAGTQCDPPLEVLRPCMLVDLSDLVARLAALEKETPDNHALAARCAASLLPKIKPITLEVTELAVDQAISASTASIEKVLTPLLERVCALEAAPPAAPNETPARAPAPVAPSSTDGPLPRPARPEDLSIGACVLLDDLKSAELNGATGTVVSLAGTNGRYGVAVPGLDAPKAFKMRNLFVFDTSASTCSSSAPAEGAASRGDSLPPRPARSSRTSRPARSQAATRTSNTRPPSRSEWEAMCVAIDWQP